MMVLGRNWQLGQRTNTCCDDKGPPAPLAMWWGGGGNNKLRNVKKNTNVCDDDVQALAVNCSTKCGACTVPI